MSWMDILLLAGVACWLGEVVIFALRRRKRGCKGCCTNCAAQCRKS